MQIFTCCSSSFTFWCFVLFFRHSTFSPLYKRILNFFLHIYLKTVTLQIKIYTQHKKFTKNITYKIFLSSSFLPSLLLFSSKISRSENIVIQTLLSFTIITLTFKCVYSSANTCVFTGVDFDFLSVLLLSPQAFSATVNLNVAFTYRVFPKGWKVKASDEVNVKHNCKMTKNPRRFSTCSIPQQHNSNSAAITRRHLPLWIWRIVYLKNDNSAELRNFT